MSSQVFGIGVTGHRVLADADRLAAGVDQAVDRLETEFPADWKVVSALAEGADRLVAQRLLARPGSQLVAVLPLAPDDYETDFGSAASRREFRELLAGADEIVQVPPQPSREEAYQQAGLAVLERSDALVTLWDGQGAQGHGGTGGIVAEARRRGLPIAWVRAGNRGPGTEQATSLGSGQGVVIFERLDGDGGG